MRGVSLGFTGSVGGWVWNTARIPASTWLRRGGLGRHGVVRLAWHPARRAWNFATTHPLLVGKHYTCVRAAMAIATLSNSGSGWGTDELDSDVFALQPAVVALPSAQWLSPKDGQTVSGMLTEGGTGAHNCAVKVTGPVVRTENYVDGKLNDTQVYCALGLRVGHAQLRQWRPSAHRQGLRRRQQRDRHRHHPGDREQPQSAADRHSSTAGHRDLPGRGGAVRVNRHRSRAMCRDSRARRPARP